MSQVLGGQTEVGAVSPSGVVVRGLDIGAEGFSGVTGRRFEPDTALRRAPADYERPDMSVPPGRPAPEQDTDATGKAPSLVVIGKCPQAAVLHDRLVALGLTALRVSVARLSALPPDTLSAVLVPAPELSQMFLNCWSALAAANPDWKDLPLIVVGNCPDTLSRPLAVLGAVVLDDPLDTSAGLSSLRAVLDLRARFLRERQRRRRQDETLTALRRRLSSEALLRHEADHRNRSILQIASGLLTFELSKSSGAQSATLARAAERIRSLAGIQDLLREAAHQGRVRLDEMMPRLCSSLADRGSGVAVQVRAEPLEAPPEDAVALGLIVTETVMNALKYGRPVIGTPTVWIELKRDDAARARLEVWDNGPGLPSPHALPPRRFGGTAIVKALAQRLGGTCSVDGDGGFRFLLSFPLHRVESDAAKHPQRARALGWP